MNRVLIIAIVGFVIIVTIIVVVSLLGRRGRATRTTQTTKTANELTIWRPADSPENFKDAIATYLQDKPNVKLNVVVKDPRDYETETLNALSAGKGPDIWAIPASSLPRHADKLTPAPDNLFSGESQTKVANHEVVRGVYAPIVAEEVIGSDQKVYGLPLSVDTLVVFASTDALNRRFQQLTNAGTLSKPELFTVGPRTWDELLELVGLLTERDGTNLRRPGVALGTANNVSQAPRILAALMLQNQTQMVSADRLSATFHLPARKPTGEQFFPGTNALEFFSSFANPSSNRYSWNATFADARELFIKGELPLLIEFSQFASEMKKRNPEFAFRMLPFPQVRGATKPVDFADYLVETVTKSAADPKLAWDFIRFMASQGLQLYLISTGRPSPLKVEALPQNILERATFGSPNQFEQQSAKSWYRGRNPQKVEAAFSQMIDDVAAGRLNPQAAIEQAAAQVSEILRKEAGVVPSAITQPQLVPQGGQGENRP